jgi:Uma2 family endonuclease
LNLAVAMRAYALSTGVCRTIIAPCDVLISADPPHFRQPDILVISNERWGKNPPSNDPAPLSPAPELVVEVISPSETAASLADKLRDYTSVDVREIWIVRPDKETVEVRQLADTNGHASASKSSRTARSRVFDGLSVPLEVIFAE